MQEHPTHPVHPEEVVVLAVAVLEAGGAENIELFMNFNVAS